MILNPMSNSKYRVLNDYLWLKRGDILQRSVGGDYYPPDHRWRNNNFRIPGPTVEGFPAIFASQDFSDEDWAHVNMNLDQEFDQ